MTPWRQHSGEILSRLFHRLIENFKDSIEILGPSTFLNPLAFLKTLVSVESRDFSSSWTFSTSSFLTAIKTSVAFLSLEVPHSFSGKSVCVWNKFLFRKVLAKNSIVFRENNLFWSDLRMRGNGEFLCVLEVSISVNRCPFLWWYLEISGSLKLKQLERLESHRSLISTILFICMKN